MRMQRGIYRVDKYVFSSLPPSRSLPLIRSPTSWSSPPRLAALMRSSSRCPSPLHKASLPPSRHLSRSPSPRWTPRLRPRWMVVSRGEKRKWEGGREGLMRTRTASQMHVVPSVCRIFNSFHMWPTLTEPLLCPRYTFTQLGWRSPPMTLSPTLPPLPPPTSTSANTNGAAAGSAKGVPACGGYNIFSSRRADYTFLVIDC
jgi:hypothetical protein